jgi:hypothetical protein
MLEMKPHEPKNNRDKTRAKKKGGRRAIKIMGTKQERKRRGEGDKKLN